ncbi:MAG: type II toxin-antitoxin system YoeB family toxin [Acidobacteriota bacterium]
MRVVGKPKSPRHQIRGLWSRRIDAERRLVYQVSETEISILQCRYNY